MKQDLPVQAAPPRAELEISLAEVLAPLRRHTRLILVGTGVCWAILLLLYLFAPPRYSCEATLVLPDVIPLEASLNKSGVDKLLGGLIDVIAYGRSAIEPTMSDVRSDVEQTKAGIPPVLYKKLERALSGAGHVSPVGSGTKDDIQKLEKDDTISAVALSHESYVANQSRDAVNALAGLVRETLITALAMEQIESEAVSSRRESLGLFRRKMDLLAANRSLERLTADLERLARDMPESRGASVREVVDTREGGYRFLPPQLQIVGAKARHADNEHTIRLLDRALSLHALRLRFLDRLQRRILGTGNAAVSDLPQVLGSELQEFLREEGPRNPDSPYVQTEMEALRDKLAAFRNNTRFIQHPTTRVLSRISLAAALASLAVVVFIAAAFVADLWQRSGGAPGVGDAAVTRKSA